MKLFSVLAVVLTVIACSDNHPPTRIKTMHLKSAGTVQYLPNEAYLSLHISCLDKDITASKDCLLKQAEELKSLIKGCKISDEDVYTNAVRQSKSYSWKHSSQVFEGYSSNMSLDLKISNIKLLDTLYPTLLTKEDVNIGYLSFSHSNIDSLNNVAYQNAVSNANRDADNLLSKMKERHKEVLKIGNVSLPKGHLYQESKGLYENSLDKEYDGYAMKAEGNSTLSVTPGTYTISKSIFVEFSIK